MLNPFPDLLTYSLLAPFLLRVVAGLIFIDLGVLAFKNKKKVPSPALAVKIFGLIEIVGGVMFVLGFYTQIAALVLAIFTFVETYIEYRSPEILKRNLVFYILLLTISLSLLLSGAGAFAIDLPL